LPTTDIFAVYTYNSAAWGYSFDRDADLNLFEHSIQSGMPKFEDHTKINIQRARTDLGRQPVRGSPISTSTPWQPAPEKSWGELQKSQRQHVNWLKDPDMVQKHIPGARLTTVSFDIKPGLSSVPSFESAARQLNDYLKSHYDGRKRVPIIFLGYTLGGLFIIKAVSDLQADFGSAESIISYTAGLFLFSYPISRSADNIEQLANTHGAKVTDKVFGELAGKDIVERFSKLAREKLYSQHPPIDREKNVQPDFPLQSASSQVAIGFPIFQFIARGETSKDLNGVTLSGLLGTPVRTVMTEKEVPNALRFTNSQDTDFLRLVMLMQSSLQTHRLLQAAALGQEDKIHTLIRRGVNVNLRDRWSQTALHIAVRMNHEKVVLKLLTAKGVDPNVRDKISNTPLHYAIRTMNEAIIRALLHRGADISLENQRKRTPRDLAEKHRSRKHIAKLLKSKLMSGPDQSPSSKRIGTGKAPTSILGLSACKNFQITVTEIYASRSSDKHWSVSISVEALLYGLDSLDNILQHVRPEGVKKDTPICVWIHIPENNMIWIEDLFQKLGLHPAIWQDTRQSITESLRNRIITPHFRSDDIQSLFFPYISYEANFRQAKRTLYIQEVDAAYQQENAADISLVGTGLSALSEKYSQESSGGRRPLLQVPSARDLESYPYRDDDSDSDFSEIDETKDPDDLEEEEKALIKAYLYDPPSLHVRRTLDQYYYHMLENTHERDIDQVVSRWSQNVKSAERHNILMVDQLWLWTCPKPRKPEPGLTILGEACQHAHNDEGRTGKSPDRSKVDYVVSCFPSRTGSGHLSKKSSDDLRLRVLDPNSRKRDPIRQPEGLISRILETCCSAFDRMQDADMLRFFQMFEDSIGTIDDKESRLFREFQRGSTRLLELDHGNKFYDEKKKALLVDLLDIREEIKLLVEVKDVRDEINIILTVLNIQQSLVEQLSQTVEGRPPLLQTPLVKNMIKIDINDFVKLDNQAKTIQEKLNTLMDLKQKAANAWEAKEARETAVAATKQGNTVLVFTIVTIVFLPLSFMSSFFAIGIAAFPHDSNSGEVNWPLGTIMGILFGVSLCVSIPLVIFALNMDYFSSLYKELRYNYLARLGLKLIPHLPFLGSEGSATSRRARWARTLQQDRENYMKSEAEGMSAFQYQPRTIGTSSTRPGISFNSTTSLQTLVNGDRKTTGSSHTTKRTQSFLSKRKVTDTESLISSDQA